MTTNSTSAISTRIGFPIRPSAILFFLILCATTGFSQPPKANNGILDARSWSLAEQRIPLNGNWVLYDHQLIAPTKNSDLGSFVNFPKSWNDLRASGEGSGYGTYRLTVLLPADAGLLALEIPQIYCSYELWINGNPIAHNGNVGTTAEETIPQWLPQTVSFDSPGDTLNIQLQIANFEHHKGGIKDPIYLGVSSMLQQQRTVSVWSNLAEVLILTLVGVLFLVIYWGSDKKKITVYFSLLCLTWAARSLFYNQYLLISYYPDFNWTATIRCEYVTLFLSLIWALLFTHRLFPNESVNTIKYVLVGINVVYIIFALFSLPIQFTQFISAYLVTCGVVLFYCVVVVIRAWVNERIGVVFLVVSLLLGILIFTYDLFAYEGLFVYNSVIFSLGYLTVFLAMAPALLLHLKIIKSKAKPSNLLTYKDLYGDNSSALR